MSDTNGPVGWLDPTAIASDLHAHSFLVNQIVGRLATTALVQVKSVSNAGSVAAVGTVSVQVLVHQTDGWGNSTPHGIINNLPYFRLQGGTNAIILDPQVGDIGMACFCSRDISSVRANKAASPPASRRRYDWADGLYVGGFLNGVPTQYVRFSSQGIDIVTPNKLTFSADNATLDSSGNLSVKGEVTAKTGGGSSVTLTGHHQTNVTAGVGNSGPPQAGT